MNVPKLKGKIVESGLNVEKLAKAIGIDRSTMYRKLSEEISLTISEAVAIKETLNLTSEDARSIFFD